MKHHFDTEAVHLSEGNFVTSSSKINPIYQTTAFTFSDLEDLEGFYQGKSKYLYTRTGNPNTDELAAAVANLEGAPAGVATSSGLSAIFAGILSVVKAGDHIVATNDIYGGTYTLLAHELKDFGIDVTFVSFENREEIIKQIKPNTKLIYTESITNPLLRVENLEQLVEIAKEHNLISMVDNTFATPYLLNPYLKGVDLVVHSATKYIGGHSDVTAGVLVGHEDLIAKARTKVVNLGLNLNPFEAWLGTRGIKTLSVRMERHVKNAQVLANGLKGHPGIRKVYYPEFVSEKGNGAIVTIDITGKCDVSKFFKSLSWVKIVPTLAGVETSVSYPLGTSHRSLTNELREQLGINEGVVRISVGIEDAEDILAVFQDALNQSIL
ncbi:trans-sulfuration enzyme family protein [Calidifontibacillus erzurumensis]|uniref:homocysteine desulfhydrase n=1 Tax=Calidifontibacillus erzurumensis TaxID=2741433 RepID=A0A8J8GGV8_9BACI|nr:aminotransferase class I/II-fold pyridoxal phosphate-dependent enzyme [Calidifontibacillus erzurumensis]NSL53142.1 aminotransferase class I/II-fold pyridoxal phosphate-dependent enzyme [Calidifontibacillus erzurumensis]